MAGKQSTLNYDDTVPHAIIMKLSGNETITFIELHLSKTMTKCIDSMYIQVFLALRT